MTDYSVITAAVDWQAVGAVILNIISLVTGVTCIWLGGEFVLAALRGLGVSSYRRGVGFMSEDDAAEYDEWLERRREREGR